MSEVERKILSTTPMTCPECESESMSLARFGVTGFGAPSPIFTIRFICEDCGALQIEEYMKGKAGSVRHVSVGYGLDYRTNRK